MRQDDAPQDARRVRAARFRAHLSGGARYNRPAAQPAQNTHGLPELRAFPDDDGLGQHRVLAQTISTPSPILNNSFPLSLFFSIIPFKLF